MEAPLTSDLKHSRTVTESLPNVAGPFASRAEQKGEEAVTRDYYQLTHEIATTVQEERDQDHRRSLKSAGGRA